MTSEDDDLAKLLQSGHNLESLIPQDLSGKDKIEHADDAEDFESEDELAEEEDSVMDDEAVGGAKGDDADWLKDLGGSDGEEGNESEDDESATLSKLKSWYKDYEPHVVLRMNRLFGPKPAHYIAPQPNASRPCVPSRQRVDVDMDQRLSWRSPIDLPPPLSSRRDIVHVKQENKPKINEKTDFSSTTVAPESDTARTHEEEKLAMVAADWDKVLDVDTPHSDDDIEDELAELDFGEESAPKRPRIDDGGVVVMHEDDIYNSDVENAILNEKFTLAAPKAQVDMNDPHLLFIEDTASSTIHRRRLLEPRYNISNDRSYEMLRENYQKKVRSTIGSLNIDHSLLALRLQSPFYKVRLSKSQMRSWHRPKFQVRAGTTINFQPLKVRKKKKDKHKPITQLLAKSGDLTLGDTAPLFLVEYSEEFPLVLSNYGMGSKIINYYRKKNPDDTSRPKLPLGETHVLDVQDRSAFWNFGFVEPGRVVPTLYNQMIRAPVFRHEPNETDFLLVRSSCKSRGQRYFLRPVPYLFVAGQTYPVTQIPGPHSRKVTTASKNRLKMIVYRVLNKNQHHRLQVKDISGHFPDQNDMQNRQRLKEFMEYQRSGEDQGYWKLKPGDALLSEEQIRQLVTPEDVAMLEAMQVGQQHLEDSGYGKTVDDDPKEDEDGESLEEQLAPWNISRNFINAIQGKAMLQLHGEGDPTARGEGFSFLRTSMKGGFKSAVDDKIDRSKLGGHSYNVALQQKAYDEEIKRIWYAQARSLQITDTSKLVPDKRVEKQAQQEIGSKLGGGNLGIAEDDELGSHKVLRITRVVKDSNDVLVRKTEVVSDANVIRAYMKRRQELEDSQVKPDQIAVTNDAEINRRRRKILEEELARLKRNQDRRQARKATKGEGDNTGSRATTRKCATCGAIGHIKTNKSCPLYNDIYLGGQNNK